jgi:hypothetical protein
MMKRFKQGLLFVLGILCGSLLFEGLMRFGEAGPWWHVLPTVEASFYAPDMHTGYRHRPGAKGLWLTENRARQEVSPQGLLDRSFTSDPVMGVTRIAVLGDSIVEALQVERVQRFTAITETELARDGIRAEVMNFGIAGATPAVMAARLAHHALPFRPKMTVMFLHLNDFISSQMGDDSQFPGYVLNDSGNVERGSSFRDGRGFKLRSGPFGMSLYWMLDNVKLVNVINARKNIGWISEVQAFNSEPVKKIQTKPGNRDCLDLTRHWKHWGERRPAEKWMRTQAFIDDIADSAAKLDQRVIFAIKGLGDVCRSNGGIRGRLLSRLSESLLEPDRGGYIVDWDARIDKALGSNRLEGALYGFGSRRGRGHLNQDGHRLYAAVLVDVLKDLLGEPAPVKFKP